MSVQVPKGYKQTEVGVIPEDWKIQSIGFFDPFVTSGSRGWADYYSEYGSLFVRITNLQRSSIYLNLDSVKFVALPSGSSEGVRTKLKKNDVLISITADIGISGFVDNRIPEDSYINQHISLVRFDEKLVNSKYVSYFLASEASQKRFKSLTDAGAKAGLNLNTVKQIPLLLPPTTEEQQAIADALSDADALIESLEQLIAKKRQIKQGAMQELLTGQRRLPGFSGEWVEKLLGSVISGLNAGVSVNSEECDSPLNTGKPCILKTSAVFDGIFIPEECKLVVNRDIHRLSTKIKKDTLVISRMNTPNLVGEVGYVERDYGNLYLPDRLWMASAVHNEIVSIRWLSYVMNFGKNKENIKELATGTSGSMKNISKDAILSMKFLFPKIQEQVEIADVLADMDKEIESLNARLMQSRKIKQSMMQELLTGRIRLI